MVDWGKMKRVRIFKNKKEEEEAELDFWLSLTPEERVEAVDSCLFDYLKLKNEHKQRLRRVLRVLKSKRG